MDDWWQNQNDCRTSNTLESASCGQHEIGKTFTMECHSSNAQLMAVDQHPFADRMPVSPLSEKLQSYRVESQDSTTQLPGGWHVPENDSAELPEVRPPAFIHREPLPQYVPEEFSPVQYHGKVVLPRHPGSFKQPSPSANPATDVNPKPTSQLCTRDLAVLPSPALSSPFVVKPQTSMMQQLRICKIVSIVFMFVFLPLGIAALTYCSRASTDYAAGRYDEAQRNLAIAKRFNKASSIFGFFALSVAGVLKAIIS